MKDSVRRLWVNSGLVVLATLAVAAVVLTQTLWTSAEREARSSHLVVGLRTDDVNRLEVTQGKQRVVVVREALAAPDSVDGDDVDGDEPAAHTHFRFRLTEPYQGEAEEAAVDGLLRAIELATALRPVDEATFDRAAAGLDEPTQVIQLGMGKVDTRLRFGNEAPSPKGARYVEVAGVGVANKGVYVISQSTAADLTVQPDAFRVKQLVPYAGSALSRVVLRQGSESALELSYDSHRNGWRVNHGNRQVRVSQLAWERLFAAFSRSQLERIVNSDATTAPSATSAGVSGVGAVSNGAVPSDAVPSGAGRVEVEFTPRDKALAQTRLVFGGLCPVDPELEFASKLAPDRVSGCTRALHLDTFIAQPESLVDDRLLSLRSDEVEEVVITRGDKVLELARRDAAWVMRRPQEGSVERDVGQAFVQTLVGLRGELVAPPGQTEIDVRVVVRSAGDTESAVQEQTFEVMRPTAEGVFAHRLDDDAWLRVVPGLSQQLVPFDLLLRQSALTSFEAKELKTVTLGTAAWQQRFAVTEQGKGCKLEAPVGYDAEPSLCLNVLDALRSLRAQSWVAQSREGQFGLETPTVKVQWQLRDDATRTLLIGAPAKGGGYYAALDQTGPVFTLSKALVDTFTTLVVSRGEFSLDPEVLQQVVVKTRSRSVALSRLGDEFVPKGAHADSQTALAPSQVQALIDALSLIKPEAAIELVASPATASLAVKPPVERSRGALGLETPLLEVTALQRTANGDVRSTHFKVGVGDVYRDVSVYYAEPVTNAPHALFVLPRESVGRVLQALEGAAL